MRPAHVVVDPPRLDELAGLGQRLEPVQVEALVAERAIERLDVSIISQFAWSGEAEAALVGIGPQIHHVAGELSAIVCEQILRGTTFTDQPV